MRIFTCTPVAFGGGPDFFARDSGLLCRGFQALGIESQAVMPGERRAEDQEDLIRTDYRNLESTEWWQEQCLDGLVLYAWGHPRFRKVAKAIHDAGIFLVLNQDNGGLVSPLAGLGGWLQDQRSLSGGRLAFLAGVAKGLSHGLLVTDPLRAAHLRCGDVIACVSPRAADHYKRLCRMYGGRDLVERIRVLPHGVESMFSFSGGTKRRQVACVGRWDDHVQKRPHLLMEVIGELVESDETVNVVIAGTAGAELHEWHGRLPIDRRVRVRLAGKIGRAELVNVFNESQVFYSPSAYESFGIAAAEALCCGCSVVAESSVSMASFEWFVSESSGSLAETSGAKAHLAAVKGELAAWDRDDRDPEAISSTWRARLHADRVAGEVVSMICGYQSCKGA